MMFLNCSNHSSKMWSIEQKNAAAKWGEIVDYPFPLVSADVDETEINNYAENIVRDMLKMRPSVVMCQGESTLAYSIITKLLQNGIHVIAACSERKAEESILADGSVQKKVLFQFVKFREYAFAKKN